MGWVWVGFALLGATCHDGVSAPAAQTKKPDAPAAQPPAPQPPPLPTDQAVLLHHWFAAAGAPRPGEAFGSFVVRVAEVQLGKHYDNPPATREPEMLTCRLDTFQCVSFVESTLAVARCLWRGQQDETCFLGELQSWRYRNGTIDGYASQLHYYVEWLDDNARRGHLATLGTDLGGTPVMEPFNYMTSHAEKYAPLADPLIHAAIAEVEQHLSSRLTPPLIARQHVATAQRALQDGDVIAIATTKPGILVSHTGFVRRTHDGVVHLLHASSFVGKVILSPTDLAGYVTRRPDRRGIFVARPVPPAMQK